MVCGSIQSKPPVHPRACGGNCRECEAAGLGRGPSPRVRGKLPRMRGSRTGKRSIPARAGETCPTVGYGMYRGVHPRACGGNNRKRDVSPGDRGPSPRVRGKPVPETRVSPRYGSIPARAGETAASSEFTSLHEVHPRACGGNLRGVRFHQWLDGPSPRVRGKHVACLSTGLAPRSIPARAGETRTCEIIAKNSEVHPRACGGNPRRSRSTSHHPGPSPRVRGKRQHRRTSLRTGGSIPARAGETAAGTPASFLRPVHPRACGGNFVIGYQIEHIAGPSPRVRGKPAPRPIQPQASGSIPARAGETCSSAHPAAGLRVHPRACGGNLLLGPSSRRPQGPSPRVRGKLGVPAVAPAVQRSIPARAARAGETALASAK